MTSEFVPLDEEALAKGEVDDPDAFFRHFYGAGNDWVTISKEADRVLGILLGEKIDRESTISSIISAATAQAAHGAFAAVARAVGADVDALEGIVSYAWYKDQDGREWVEPAGWERLATLVREYQKHRSEENQS